MLVQNGKFLGKYNFAWAVMVACCILQAFGMGLVLNCGALFYVPVCNDLGFTRAEISTYMAGYFVGNTITMPIAGHILTKYDMRKVIAASTVVLGISIFAMSFYHEIWQWQLSGTLVGISGAFIFVLPAASLTGSWFVKHRGLVYGVVMACSGISAAVFSMVINAIIGSAGWRVAYQFVGIACMVAILPCCLFFYNKPRVIGAVPYGYDAEKLVDGVRPSEQGVPTKVAVMSIPFWCLFLFAGIASFCHGGVNQHTPAFIQSVGFTATFAASIVSFESMGSVFDKLFMGYLNDKIGVKWTAILQFCIILLGLFGFIFSRNPVVLYVAAVCFGIQDSLMSVSLPLLIRSIFGNANYTQIHAWIRCGVGLFGSFSGILVGHIFDVTGSYLPAFYVMIFVCLAGILTVVAAYYFAKRHGWGAPVKQS